MFKVLEKVYGNSVESVYIISGVPYANMDRLAKLYILEPIAIIFVKHHLKYQINPLKNKSLVTKNSCENLRFAIP